MLGYKQIISTASNNQTNDLGTNDSTKIIMIIIKDNHLFQ